MSTPLAACSTVARVRSARGSIASLSCDSLCVRVTLRHMSSHNLSPAVAWFERVAADNTREFWQREQAAYRSDVSGPFAALLAEVDRDASAWKVYRPHNDTRFGSERGPLKTFIGALRVEPDGTGRYLQLDARGLLASSGMPFLAPDQLSRWRCCAARCSGLGVRVGRGARDRRGRHAEERLPGAAGAGAARGRPRASPHRLAALEGRRGLRPACGGRAGCGVGDPVDVGCRCRGLPLARRARGAERAGAPSALRAWSATPRSCDRRRSSRQNRASTVPCRRPRSRPKTTTKRLRGGGEGTRSSRPEADRR